MFDQTAIEKAFHELRFGSLEQRAAAAKVLGEVAYAPAVPHLTELVQNADPGTRYLAAMALSKIGDEAESALPVLLQALREDDMYLRMAITAALISIGLPAVPGLVRALFDHKAPVRRASAKALGKIGSRDAINPLKVAAQDSDPHVSRFAIEALARIEAQ